MSMAKKSTGGKSTKIKSTFTPVFGRGAKRSASVRGGRGR